MVQRHIKWFSVLPHKVSRVVVEPFPAFRWTVSPSGLHSTVENNVSEEGEEKGVVGAADRASSSIVLGASSRGRVRKRQQGGGRNIETRIERRVLLGPGERRKASAKRVNVSVIVVSTALELGKLSTTGRGRS